MKNLKPKQFKVFHVIIILRNHYFIILKLIRAIKGFILYQIKQMALKSGYIVLYKLLQIHGHQVN